MENFITGHLLNKNVDVHCGGSDRFSGKVIACADEVLTLETARGVFTHIAITKIVAIWPGVGTVAAAKPKKAAAPAAKHLKAAVAAKPKKAVVAAKPKAGARKK